jgi:hypothetical protein
LYIAFVRIVVKCELSVDFYIYSLDIISLLNWRPN